MNDVRRLKYNTRERASSTDLDATTDLLIRHGIQQVAAMMEPAEATATIRGSGVLSGLRVGATGINLIVTVESGAALLYDPTAAGVYDSPYRWIEVVSQLAVDLTPFVNPAQPRWICLEITPGSETELASQRDIFNPALGTFTPQEVVKVVNCAPVVTITAGTPAATPVLPLGVAGRLPLAYIYVPAAAVVVGTAYVVGCRPLLNSRWGQLGSSCVGGGFDVLADNSSIAQLATDVKFSPGFCGFSVYAPAANPVDLDTVGDVRLASGYTWPPPGTAAPIYGYVMTAPYPEGYPVNMAVREFRPGDPATIQALIPSATPNALNGIIAFASGAPSPAKDPYGFDLTLALSGVNDPVWNGGPGANVVQQMRVCYVGSVIYDPPQTAKLLPQRCQDSKWVRFTSQPATGSVSVVQGPGTSQLGTLGRLRRANPWTLAGDLWAPETAHVFDVWLSYTVNNASNAMTWSISSDEPIGDQFLCGYSLNMPNAGGFHSRALWHTVDGNFLYSVVNNGAATMTLTMQVQGYIDSMLSRR